MDFRLIPDSLRDIEKTGYLLSDMPVNEVVQIAREALRNVDYGTRNTCNIELWVHDEYDKQGTIDYLSHFIHCGKLRYSDILNAYRLFNPFFELDPSRPIDWMDTLMKEKKKEEVFLTDDFDYVPIPKKILITNPRWEHKDAAKKEKSPKEAAFDDTVILMADVTGIPENGPVTFEIFDTSGKAPVKIDSANGKNVGGVAKGDWVVTDKNNKGEDLKLEFQATAKSKTSTRCGIPLSTAFEIHLQIDVDDPAAKDDTLILLDENGSEVMKLCVGEMEEVSEDVVCLKFEDLSMDTKYSLVRDYGADDDGGQDPLFVKLSINEIREYFKD